jgi:hypothetical protein
MQVTKLILEKGVSATLKSEGELLHSVHVMFYVPESDINECCPKERYRRIAVETEPPIRLTMYMGIKNARYSKRCRREYIQYGDRLLDVLVPEIEKMTFENMFKTTLDHIGHIPPLVLPGDEILMSFYAHQPFQVTLRVDW